MIRVFRLLGLLRLCRLRRLLWRLESRPFRLVVLVVVVVVVHILPCFLHLCELFYAGRTIKVNLEFVRFFEGHFSVAG